MLLIISENKQIAEDLSDMFNFMGVLSYALTPEDAPLENPEIYRAILVMSPEKIKNGEELYLMLETYLKNIPVFSLGKAPTDINFSYELSENLSAAEIFDAICKRCRECGFSSPGDYRLEFINASVTNSETLFFSQNLKLTKTELMIVRVLLRHFPSPIKPFEILKFAFRKNRTPDEPSIRTHISKINKKASKISGRNLIFNFGKNGYILKSH